MPRADCISIFDASLLWFDKDPNPDPRTLQHYSYGCGWIVVLTRDHEVHDLALALLSAVAEGSIRAKTKSFLPYYIPKDWTDRLNSPGRLDPRGTKIAISDLVKFAKELDQKPNSYTSAVDIDVYDADMVCALEAALLKYSLKIRLSCGASG